MLLFDATCHYTRCFKESDMTTIEEWDTLEQRFKDCVTPVPFDLDEQIEQVTTEYVLRCRQAHHRPMGRVSKTRTYRKESIGRKGSGWEPWGRDYNKVAQLITQDNIDALYETPEGNSPLSTPVVVDEICTALPGGDPYEGELKDIAWMDNDDYEDEMQSLQDQQYINALTGFVPVNV
jgi:hypothetical protein